jgi:LuxR family maltose regulon positive regulatory protein
MTAVSHQSSAELLKVTPPRVPRELLARPRLLGADTRLGRSPAVLLQAPAGFGKSSLLAQWRRDHLAHGAAVAWLSAQPQDSPPNLLRAMVLAVRVGAARPTFGHTLLDGAPSIGLDGFTAWLAELNQTALDLVLTIDEADRLPPESRESLAYVLRNAPPNLRVRIASRTDADLGLDDLIGYGDCVVLGLAQLRFTLEETIELVRARFGSRIDHDDAARLHEAVDGWPLGLQLALTIMADGPDPRARIADLTAPRGELHEHFVGLLLRDRDPVDVDLLVRSAALQHLHADLCRTVSGIDDAAPRLERLARDTPLLVAAEQGEWLRMHTVARDALRRRFAALAAALQTEIHGRATEWLAEHGLYADAVEHALAAGRDARAYELAERGLYDMLIRRGPHGAAYDWLRQLPAIELDRRPGLQLAAAWAMALGERHAEAGQMVDRLLGQREADEPLLCECALILGAAAVYADDPDRFARLHDPWADNPPLHGRLLRYVHANRTAYRALLAGEPALARLRQQQAPRADGAPELAYVNLWGELFVGLSYVWEGQMLLAESLLRPTLARADGDFGRRSPLSCMLAALLASVVWELDRPDEAQALLANRLDVLERTGLTEFVMLGYRTLARAAAAGGAEHRAIQLLWALHAVGASRALPRLCIASLSDQVRIHARRYRAETCRELCGQIDRLRTEAARGPLWRRNVDVMAELAQGYAAIAAQDWRAALEPLARAEDLARRLKFGRLQIEVMGLRAFALDRCGERARPLLQEAVGLADTYGLQRVFADAHPDLGRWVLELSPAAADAAPPVPPPRRDTASLRGAPSMALTPKEREVLELLARNLSNKEIGRAMQVGEETIKWHVKNLFAKLDAGTRKQVVQRARILGLLQEAD